jgi:N-acetylglucosaminyl-diphospho-decaprenol L-rhamnosyltransferase
VHRHVFENIGYFDENFRIGVFEDTDFFLRARRSGLKLATTGCSFIHHFGSITQKAIRKDVKRPYEAENRAYFRQKWKLSGPRRFWMRLCSKTARHLACWREKSAHGHSLHETWEDGELRLR